MLEELPAPCEVCGPQGGLFVVIEVPGRTSGAGRCTVCERGRMLAARDEAHKALQATGNRPAAPAPGSYQALDFEEVLPIIGELTQMHFFPSDASGRLGIARLVCRMATSIEQVQVLVDRMLALYNDWPGPLELRAVFCSAGFAPADGYWNDSSKCFPDGIPAPVLRPVETAAIESGRQYFIGSGEAVSQDPELARPVANLVEMKSMARPAAASVPLKAVEAETAAEADRLALELELYRAGKRQAG